MSYLLMKDPDNYQIRSGSSIRYTLPVTDNLQRFRQWYEDWLHENGYQLDLIKTLTALIFIGMCPLHEPQMGDILFYHAKYMLTTLQLD